MSDAGQINSTVYWDDRFAENWEACQGPAQSRFFSKLAIDCLPGWLIDRIRRDSMTVCDWGCAQGDGTDVWASYVDQRQLTGVDFSSIAVAQAVRRYPAIRFVAQDWLAQTADAGETFDIVFSSNTLEHFHRPYEVLDVLSCHARIGLALALPYQETERIEEHFFTFLPDNIPLVLRNGFRLAWSSVKDCRLIAGALWGGNQVIVFYASPSWLDSHGLMLKDCLINQHDSQVESARLNALLVERDAQIEQIKQMLRACSVSIHALDLQMHALTSSLSWRLTSPLRIARSRFDAAISRLRRGRG